MWPRAWLTWTDERQATSADRLRAGIKGSGCDGQVKIAMTRQRRGLRGRGLRGWTDGRAGTSNPDAEWPHGLSLVKFKYVCPLNMIFECKFIDFFLTIILQNFSEGYGRPAGSGSINIPIISTDKVDTQVDLLAISYE